MNSEKKQGYKMDVQSIEYKGHSGEIALATFGLDPENAFFIFVAKFDDDLPYYLLIKHEDDYKLFDKYPSVEEAGEEMNSIAMHFIGVTTSH